MPNVAGWTNASYLPIESVNPIRAISTQGFQIQWSVVDPLQLSEIDLFAYILPYAKFSQCCGEG